MQGGAQGSLEPYLSHLLAVNEARGVYAVEDVFTADGALLIRARQALPARLPELLARYALRRPLQSLVQVDSPVTEARLRDDIISTLPPAQMHALYGHYGLDEELQRGTAIVTRHPHLQQQLTVLAVRLPDVYRQSLISAWISVVIAIRMKLARSERAELVVGALSHQLGMLHIRPDVASRTSGLDAEGWAEMQRYVERGQAALAAIPNLSPAIVRMVAEHRELPDGTGYPMHLEDAELGLPGQIIGVAQSALSIYFKTLKPAGRSVRDLIPIIQINSAVYRRDVCSALLQLLREQQLSEASIVSDASIETMVAGLLKNAAILAECRPVIQRCVRQIAGQDPQAAARVVKIHAHLESILSSSAVLDESQIAWMQKVADLRYRQFYRDIDDLGLMLGEVRWQLQRLARLLNELRAALPEEDRAALAGVLDSLQQVRR